jgi:hypothetical protein
MEKAGNYLCIGWDVGAHKCSPIKNSCDAIVFIEKGKIIGSCRENLSNEIYQMWSNKLGLDGVIGLWAEKCKIVNFNIGDYSEIVIAIDAPLGWPKKAIPLIRGDLKKRDGLDLKFSMKKNAINNPFLFRYCERKLGSGLSVITHSIGSQSIKAMMFVNSSGLVMEDWGVWSSGISSKSNSVIKIIEAYPSACKKSEKFINWSKGLNLFGSHLMGQKFDQDDSYDAGICALVAKAFVCNKRILKFPPKVEGNKKIKKEGWIFFPKDVPKNKKNNDGFKDKLFTVQENFKSNKNSIFDDALYVNQLNQKINYIKASQKYKKKVAKKASNKLEKQKKIHIRKHNYFLDYEKTDLGLINEIDLKLDEIRDRILIFESPAYLCDFVRLNQIIGNIESIFEEIDSIRKELKSKTAMDFKDSLA